jgi:methionine-rich copper-binding protein CopC
MNSKRVQTLLALSIVFLSFLNSSAQAHSVLESSNPAKGQMVETLPSELSLTFNEELISIEGETVSTLSLKGADGASYELLSPTIDGAVLSAQVAGGEYPAGDYLLSYRAVSGDGHPITGDIAFSTNSSTTVEYELATPVTTSYIPEPVESSSNVLFYLLGGLVLLVGILFGVKRKRGSWQK